MYNLHQIPSEAQIKKFIRRTVFGKNIFCPECRSRKVAKDNTRYRCRRCRIKFSLVSHTWLRGTKLSYQKLWLVLWCWTCEISIQQTMEISKLSEEAVRRWYGRFRAHLPPDTHVLEHIVQMDEAFFRDMTLIMGKEQHTRKLAYTVLPGTSPERHHATHFLFQKVRPGSTLRTDGAGIYRGIDKWWPVTHEVDIHRKWEFGKTSEIEGVFGNYRTFVRRMYHHHWSENLEEYVREFCFRFSSPELFGNPRYYAEKTLSLVTFD